jgi:hypothetical protein
MRRCLGVLGGLTAFLAVAISAVGSQNQPVPASGRVAFPQGYREKYQLLRRFEKAEKKQVVTVYGNNAAASVKSVSELPYPYGSVIVMETSDAVTDPEGKATLDENGQYRQDKALGLHVMKKERGFGVGYQQDRTGEWEYVEYHPDGSYITPPDKSAVCAKCHVKAGQEKDFVYGGRFHSSRSK